MNEAPPVLISLTLSNDLLQRCQVQKKNQPQTVDKSAENFKLLIESLPCTADSQTIRMKTEKLCRSKGSLTEFCQLQLPNLQDPEGVDAGTGLSCHFPFSATAE